MPETSQVFTDPTIETYASKAKLLQELQQLCSTGIVFFYVLRGVFVTRPEMKILSNCEIFVRHISYKGAVSDRRFNFEEVKYESLTFN